MQIRYDEKIAPSRAPLTLVNKRAPVSKSARGLTSWPVLLASKIMRFSTWLCTALESELQNYSIAFYLINIPPDTLAVLI